MNKQQFQYLNCTRSKDKTKPRLRFFNVAEGGTVWTTDGHRVHILGDTSKCSPVLRLYAATSAKMLANKIRESRPSDTTVVAKDIDRLLKNCKFTRQPFTIVPEGEETLILAAGLTDDLALENREGRLFLLADLDPFGQQECPLQTERPLTKKSWRVSVRGQYLLDALESFSEVTLGPDHLAPLRVVTWIGGTEATSIIMPLRLPAYLQEEEDG